MEKQTGETYKIIGTFRNQANSGGAPSSAMEQRGNGPYWYEDAWSAFIERVKQALPNDDDYEENISEIEETDRQKRARGEIISQ